MGLFDRIFRKRQNDRSTYRIPHGGPDDLRTCLFDAVAAGDHELLAKLCLHNWEGMGSNFLEWKTVPADMRADPAKLQWYGQGLVGVARCYAGACSRFRYSRMGCSRRPAAHQEAPKSTRTSWPRWPARSKGRLRGVGRRALRRERQG